MNGIWALGTVPIKLDSSPKLIMVERQTSTKSAALSSVRTILEDSGCLRQASKAASTLKREYSGWVGDQSSLACEELELYSLS